MMKKVLLAGMFLSAACGGFAMPVKTELLVARERVEAATAPVLDAFRNGTTTAEKAALEHELIADRTVNEADKYLLLQGAFKLYARCGKTDMAVLVLRKIDKCITDVPYDVIADLVHTELHEVASEKANEILEQYRQRASSEKKREGPIAVTLALDAKAKSDAGKVKEDASVTNNVSWGADPVESIIAGMKRVPGKECFLSITEVTERQWEAIMGNNPSGLGPNRPVGYVSWDDANEFIRKLNANPKAQASGYIFRLPSKDEWSYTALAGSNGKLGLIASGVVGEIDQMAWYVENSGGTTHDVGTKMPNAWGFFDMHGNVWEWTSYQSDNSKGCRKGCGYGDSSENIYRYINGGMNTPSYRKYAFCGLRLASDAPIHSASRSESNPANNETAKVKLANITDRVTSVQKSNGAVTEKVVKGSVRVFHHAGECKVVNLPGNVPLELVWVAPGEFQMGAENENSNPNERPVHTVRITKGYWIGKRMITHRQWNTVLANEKKTVTDDDSPMADVQTWRSCRQFMESLNKLCPDMIFDLPTEAQWEFAALGGTLGGARLTHGIVENEDENNPLGISGMFDSVREWCKDWYSMYGTATVSDPIGTISRKSYYKDVVVRGGSWGESRINVAERRAKHRYSVGIEGGSWIASCGIRVVAYEDESDQIKMPESASDGEEQGKNSTELTKKEKSEGATPAVNIVPPKVKTIMLPDNVPLELVWVEPGEFEMGSSSEDANNDESPVRKVKLTKGYWIGRYELTAKQWNAVMQPGTNRWERNYEYDEPTAATYISWDSGCRFLDKINKLQDELQFSYPTEAQWEFAAKGGVHAKGWKFSGGNDIYSVGQFRNNSVGHKLLIGTKMPNELGIYDMSGNSAEWCKDWYGKYQADDVVDPQGPTSGVYKVRRGGGYRDFSETCRTTCRSWKKKSSAVYYSGMRLVATEIGTGDAKSMPVNSPLIIRPSSNAKTKSKTDDIISGIVTGTARHKAGEVRTFVLPGGAKIEMVYCPPGTFMMGNSENGGRQGNRELRHRAVLTKGFWIGKYELTQKQWRSVMGSNPSISKADKLPVDNVSWDDCMAFCDRAGTGWRLPTEAEWEYASRGGPLSKGYVYSGSNSLRFVGWFGAISDGGTHPVGSKAPNELGIYDMSGNVYEWCQDYFGDYPVNPVPDYAGPTSGENRVCRGGGWGCLERICRSDCRFPSHSNRKEDTFGMRLAISEADAVSKPVASATSGETNETAVEESDKNLADSIWALAKDAKAGDVKTVTLPGGVEMEMIYCPPGTFVMGSPEEELGRGNDELRHSVTLTKGFWIGKYEVTQKQWKAVVGPSWRSNSGESLPVTGVSWADGLKFCKLAGMGLRLPTEAEWEFASRGGPLSKRYMYSGSDNLDSVAWFGAGADGRPHTVGTKAPNELGIYDMSGNVREWCHDGYGSYPSKEVTDPRGEDSFSRVIRGGSCGDDAASSRSAKRSCSGIGSFNGQMGFRVARTAE